MMPKEIDNHKPHNIIAVMAKSKYYLPLPPLPIKGTYTVISPDDRGKEQPQIYYLVNTSIVFAWTTWQEDENIVWVKDVLNNTWIVVEPEDLTDK